MFLYIFPGEFKVGTLVGTDEFGHRYFHDPSLMYSRDRWVEFPVKKWNSTTRDSQEASSIPPEWHAWLSRFSDKTPVEA